MKSNLLSLVVILATGTLVLSGCCNNHKDAKQFCLDNWWTYSVVTSQDEEYGECSFPSWVGCRDEILLTDECNFIADTTNIDTEEKRLAGCEESAKGWIKDFENWENVNILWEDESEAGASFVRNWVIHYTKDWSNWKIDVECVADFVDWSISTSYGDAIWEDWVKTEWKWSSDIYSDEDLQDAVEKIVNYFDLNIENREIFYQWDEESAEQLNYCKDLNSDIDECVVFKTNFFVPEQDAMMAWALEPNKTIADYEWYIGRSAWGTWNVLTAGY